MGGGQLVWQIGGPAGVRRGYTHQGPGGGRMLVGIGEREREAGGSVQEAGIIGGWGGGNRSHFFGEGGGGNGVWVRVWNVDINE